MFRFVGRGKVKKVIQPVKPVWDKWSGNIRVESKGLVVLMSLNTQKGRAWQDGEEITDPDSLKKKLEKIPNIPVIIHSAYSHFQDDHRSWSAEEYVVKSSDLRHLKSAVKRALFKWPSACPLRASPTSRFLPLTEISMVGPK